MRLSMVRSALKVYCGPEDSADNRLSLCDHPHSVTVPLGEILPMLADAVQSRRTWLVDFANDGVTISTDLYEVILAYQHYRRPSA
ncbi:MAG: hypothetical protein SFX18_00140 [Pirellulales bacterium]|nr:hypothetical protein [Pirellulales bacterium]